MFRRGTTTKLIVSGIIREFYSLARQRGTALRQMVSMSLHRRGAGRKRATLKIEEHGSSNSALGTRIRQLVYVEFSDLRFGHVFCRFFGRPCMGI